MIALAIKIGLGLFKPLRWLLDWLRDDFRHVVIAVLLALACLFFVQRGDARADAANWQVAAFKWKDAAGAWRKAHGDVVCNVAIQREAARKADLANAARVEREQAQAIERTKHAYEAQLADTRTALERVHGDLRRATTTDEHSGGGGTADLPNDYSARCRAFGAPDCDIFFAALPGQLAAAEDNTTTLIALQDYVRSLLAIDWQGDGSNRPNSGREGGAEREGASAWPSEGVE